MPKRTEQQTINVSGGLNYDTSAGKLNLYYESVVDAKATYTTAGRDDRIESIDKGSFSYDDGNRVGVIYIKADSTFLADEHEKIVSNGTQIVGPDGKNIPLAKTTGTGNDTQKWILVATSKDGNFSGVRTNQYGSDVDLTADLRYQKFQQDLASYQTPARNPSIAKVVGTINRDTKKTAYEQFVAKVPTANKLPPPDFVETSSSSFSPTGAPIPTTPPQRRDPVQSSPPIPPALKPTVQSFKTLVYPESIQDHISQENGVDFLLIQIVEYKPIGTGTNDTSNLIRTNRLISSAVSKGSVSEVQNNKREIKKVFNVEKQKNSIILPIPSSISDGNSVSYGENSLDALSAGLIGLYGNLVEQGAIGIKEGNNFRMDQVYREFDNFLKTNKSAAKTAMNASLQAQVANLSTFGASATAEGVLARQTGAILNPNKELLFNGVNIRQFKFTFKLTPRSKTEGETIKRIIRVLKQNMAPKVTQGGGFLKTPNIFNLEYRRGSQKHPFLNSFKQCALTNMNVNYTGDGTYSTYEDSTPISMTMDLTFKELEPIYDADYDAVSEREGVGF